MRSTAPGQTASPNTRMRRLPIKRCAIANCRETLPPFAWLSLCPSCRVAGTYGAALAAEMAGDAKSARRHYSHLVQMAGKGEPRAELTLAKAYLSQ